VEPILSLRTQIFVLYIPNPKDLKQEGDSSPLFIKFYREYSYAIKKIRESQDGLKLNGEPNFMIYVDVDSLYGKKKVPRRRTLK
jgi:hypothetical protein